MEKQIKINSGPVVLPVIYFEGQDMVIVTVCNKIRVENIVFNVKYFNLSRMFVKSLNVYHESAETSHIPRPAALDDLVGSSSAFVHVCCHTYVQYTYTSAWKLAPEGLIPLTMLFLFLYLNTTNQTIIYMNFEIWK